MQFLIEFNIRSSEVKACIIPQLIDRTTSNLVSKDDGIKTECQY